MAIPIRSSAERGDPMQPVRGALAYLGQFHERGLPRTLIEWLASGEPARARRHGAAARRDGVAGDRGRGRGGAGRSRRAARVDARTWYGEWPRGASFALRMARFDRTIDAAGTLASYAARLRARGRVQMGPIPAACELLESGTVSGEQLPAVYDYLLVRTLAEAVLRDRPELDRFSGSVHETRRAQFAGLDERFIALTRHVVAQRANAVPAVRGVGYGPVAELTEQSLIEHEIEKTRRHIPIREMFRRAGPRDPGAEAVRHDGAAGGGAVPAAGLFHFDLVVMDEASQMRPEDALGADRARSAARRGG